MDLEITVEALDTGTETILCLAGELDIYTSPKLEAQIAALPITRGYRLIMDLLDLTYVDSVGLGVLSSALSRLRGLGGDLCLVVSPGSSVYRLLTLTEMAKRFHMYEHVSEASRFLRAA